MCLRAWRGVGGGETFSDCEIRGRASIMKRWLLLQVGSEKKKKKKKTESGGGILKHKRVSESGGISWSCANAGRKRKDKITL